MRSDTIGSAFDTRCLRLIGSLAALMMAGELACSSGGGGGGGAVGTGPAEITSANARVISAATVVNAVDLAVHAATTDITNARAEALNSRIQWVKRMACGFRNRQNFRNAIYFHLGGLDLYPETLKSAHSKS